MKKLIILTVVMLGMGTSQVGAQGFLGKLKNKAEQALKGKANKTIDKVVDKATPQVVKDAAKKVNNAEATVRGSRNRATTSQRRSSAGRGIANFQPAKKTITIKLCEGVGRKIWHGRVGGITPMPPENGPKQVTWAEAQPQHIYETNARLVAENKMMRKWQADNKPYLEPTMMRKEGSDGELSDRVNALEEVVQLILKADKDEEEQLARALEKPAFKRAVNSDWAPLYPSLPADVVTWLKGVDRTSKTLDVTVWEGNSSSQVLAQQGEMWFKVNTDTREATLEYLDMDQSVGRDYTVPASITYAGHTFRVTTIGEVAFGGLKVRSVTLPEGLKTIGRQAFTRTSIASFTIPSTVTKIENRAFADNPALKTITVPNSVREMGLGIFGQCTALTSATLPETIDKMGNTIFMGCKSLTQVRLPKNLTAILESTFQDCKSLTHIDLPSTLTKIGANAFQNTGFTSLTLPDGITVIGSQAFAGCSRLTQVSIPNSAEVQFMAFKDCKALKKVAIGERYKATPWELYSMFMGCSFVNPRMTTTPACVTYNP